MCEVHNITLRGQGSPNINYSIVISHYGAFHKILFNQDLYKLDPCFTNPNPRPHELNSLILSHD